MLFTTIFVRSDDGFFLLSVLLIPLIASLLATKERRVYSSSARKQERWLANLFSGCIENTTNPLYLILLRCDLRLLCFPYPSI